MTTPLVIVTFITLLFVVRPITVMIHELGHGIAALVLTNEGVTLYVGSYGNPDQSIILSVGRLKFFFRYNPFLWTSGLCEYHIKEISFNRLIVITLLGPLTSLILGLLCCYVAIITDVHGSIKIISAVLLVSSVFDFFINMVPRKEPICLYDGSIAHNDGQTLRQLSKYKILPSQFTAGTSYYNQKEYKKAALEFQSIIDSGLKQDIVFKYAITAYLQAKDYEAVFGFVSKI